MQAAITPPLVAACAFRIPARLSLGPQPRIAGAGGEAPILSTGIADHPPRQGLGLATAGAQAGGASAGNASAKAFALTPAPKLDIAVGHGGILPDR